MLEELLGALAEWVGFDLRKMSPRRAMFVAAFYLLAGFCLFVGGLVTAIAYRGDTVTVFGGAICALIGAAWMARTAWNVAARRERRDEGSVG
jgi:hypothetical protein